MSTNPARIEHTEYAPELEDEHQLACVSCGIPISYGVYCGPVCERTFEARLKQKATWARSGDLTPLEKFVLKFGTRTRVQ